MTKMSNIRRLHMNIPIEIHSYFEEESKKYGMSTSGLINFALKNYIDQQKAVVSVNEVIKHLEEIKIQAAKSLIEEKN